MTNSNPIIVEETYQSSIENIWKAITELDQLKKWFFEQIKTFEAKVGFETQFLIENEGRKFTHLWKIIEVVPQQKIKYNWRYKEYEGNSYVTFEITIGKNGVKLRLTAEGLESFPSDIPEFTRESCIGGWKYFLKERLKDYLSN